MAKNTSKHVVIAGGGTGGHLFPGIALAQELRRLDPDVRVTFVGTAKGIEARVLPGLGEELELMEVQGLKGSGLGGMIVGAAKLPMAGIKAMAMVRRLKPSIVVAVGGYASGPFTMCAAMMGIPTVLLEQNSVPGVTNKTLAKVVKRAFLTYESSRAYFPASKVEVVGNPLRRELVEEGLAFEYAPPSSAEDVNVLVLGGSGGSLALNKLVPQALGQLDESVKARLKVTHQVGKQSGEIARDAYAETFGERAQVVNFIEDMASAYAGAHLLVCRAGATTIAEVLAFGLPAIYVPFPGAADDHQTRNALDIAEAGGGVLVEEPTLSEGRLERLVTGLVENPESLGNMANAARALGRPDAGEVIARYCLEHGR